MTGEKPEEVKPLVVEGDDDGEEEEEEDSWSSDSEIGEALDWLDTKDGSEVGVDGPISLNSRRPNAHGGLHSRINASTLQPLSNRNQKFSNHIHASPLEVCISFSSALCFPREWYRKYFEVEFINLEFWTFELFRPIVKSNPTSFTGVKKDKNTIQFKKRLNPQLLRNQIKARILDDLKSWFYLQR